MLLQDDKQDKLFSVELIFDSGVLVFPIMITPASYIRFAIVAFVAGMKNLCPVNVTNNRADICSESSRIPFLKISGLQISSRCLSNQIALLFEKSAEFQNLIYQFLPFPFRDLNDVVFLSRYVCTVKPACPGRNYKCRYIPYFI